jgi:protein tyrosine phosphatase (PTP) superfamily phosphohydrolase (DUF442 family)
MRMLLAPLLVTACHAAHALTAPNVVPIHDRWVTAGQPPAAALKALKAEGFEAVIYLAPPTVGDAVPEEPLWLSEQGIDYVNIPIVFDRPSEADFEAFAAAIAVLRKDGVAFEPY